MIISTGQQTNVFAIEGIEKGTETSEIKSLQLHVHEYMYHKVTISVHSLASYMYKQYSKLQYSCNMFEVKHIPDRSQ